ncbi:hypothetical protein ACVWW6_004274 [Bradyrhizobium sp. USDA 3311]
MLRHKLLSAYRQKAVEKSPRRIDVPGMPWHLQDAAEIETVKNVLDLQLSPSSAADIEAKLRSYGFDQRTLNTEVCVQAREILSLCLKRR